MVIEIILMPGDKNEWRDGTDKGTILNAFVLSRLALTIHVNCVRFHIQRLILSSMKPILYIFKLQLPFLIFGTL